MRDAEGFKAGFEDGEDVVLVAGVSGFRVGEAEASGETAHEVEGDGVGQWVFCGAEGVMIREAAAAVEAEFAEEIEGFGGPGLGGAEAFFERFFGCELGFGFEGAEAGEDEAAAFGVDQPPAVGDFFDAEEACGGAFFV